MTTEAILAKLNAIEEAQTTKIEVIKAEAAAGILAAEAAFAEKVANLEAKVAAINSPHVLKIEKTVRGDVNKMVKEQLKEFHKSNGRVEKEVKLFESAEQHDAFLREAAGLTGSGAGIGGRTAYDPVFTALRLANPMRGLSRSLSTDGSTYQFRAKTGNAGATWGYAIQNNGSATTEATAIWQLTMADLNVQFPIRTSALDDIDGLESNVVGDMLAEFSQVEAQSMIQNSDQTDSPNTYGGTSGLRGLNQYPGAAATYAGGVTTTPAFGTSGTGSTNGLHTVATYDQLTSNVNTVGANAITYKDVINLVYALPQQYWTASAKFMISPILLQAIRGLVDSNGRPIFNADIGLSVDGIVGQLLGFDVIVNKYLDTPSQVATGSAGTVSKYPMFFGDWNRAHAIVDKLNMVLRRYDQTLPGYITFFGEKRLATSIVDPNAIVRYRSTGTAAA